MEEQKNMDSADGDEDLSELNKISTTVDTLFV